MCVVLAVLVYGSSCDETSTPFSLENIINNVKNSEAFKNVQKQVENINASDIQQKAKEISEAVKPILDKIQSNFDATAILEQIKKNVGPLMDALNSTEKQPEAH